MANWNESEQLVHGDNLLLYLVDSGTVLAYATSCSIQVDSESIDTSSKFSCKWASNMGGKASYTISADALYANMSGDTGAISFDGLLELMVCGNQVEWYMGEEQDWTGSCETNPHSLDIDKTYYNGKAVVTSCSLEAGNNEIASCSITLTGAGPIAKNGQDITCSD